MFNFVLKSLHETCYFLGNHQHISYTYHQTCDNILHFGKKKEQALRSRPIFHNPEAQLLL